MTDEYLCVKGSNGTIFAMGDAATVEQPKAISRAKVSISTPCVMQKLQHLNWYMAVTVATEYT